MSSPTYSSSRNMDYQNTAQALGTFAFPGSYRKAAFDSRTTHELDYGDEHKLEGGLLREGTSHSDGETSQGYVEEEELEDEPESIGEDIYGLAMASLIRDYQRLFVGSAAKQTRYLRMASSIILVLACIGLQMFLLQAVYGLLCKSAVQHIRDDYSKYQLVMYGSDHVRLNENGYYRGVSKEFLKVDNFAMLSSHEKYNVCDIPLAHVPYLMAILLIWTMTCLSDFRSTVDQVRGLIILTPTVSDLNHILERQGGGVSLVKTLTRPMKVMLAVCCFLPRMVSTLVLLYLGSRWLLATNDLNDLFLNSLALEFMLGLKYLLYTFMTSKRNKALAVNTHIYGPPSGKLGLLSAFGAKMWMLAALIWVYMYTFYIQGVLPEYGWDVREVCATWKGAQHMGGLSV